MVRMCQAATWTSIWEVACKMVIVKEGHWPHWVALLAGVGACVCLWVCLRVRCVDGVVGGVGGCGKGGVLV